MPKGKPTDPQKIKDQINRGHLLGMVKDAKRSGDGGKAEKLTKAMKKGHEDSARGHVMQKGQKQKRSGDIEKAKKTFSTVGKIGYHPKNK